MRIEGEIRLVTRYSQDGKEHFEVRGVLAFPETCSPKGFGAEFEVTGDRQAEGSYTLILKKKE